MFMEVHICNNLEILIAKNRVNAIKEKSNDS